MRITTAVPSGRLMIRSDLIVRSNKVKYLFITPVGGPDASAALFSLGHIAHCMQ